MEHDFEDRSMILLLLAVVTTAYAEINEAVLSDVQGKRSPTGIRLDYVEGLDAAARQELLNDTLLMPPPREAQVFVGRRRREAKGSSAASIGETITRALKAADHHQAGPPAPPDPVLYRQMMVLPAEMTAEHQDDSAVFVRNGVFEHFSTSTTSLPMQMPVRRPFSRPWSWSWKFNQNGSMARKRAPLNRRLDRDMPISAPHARPMAHDRFSARNGPAFQSRTNIRMTTFGLRSIPAQQNYDARSMFSQG